MGDQLHHRSATDFKLKRKSIINLTFWYVASTRKRAVMKVSPVPGPTAVRVHNSTGKCAECSLQAGIKRDYEMHPPSGPADGSEGATNSPKQIAQLCRFPLYFSIAMVSFVLFWSLLLVKIFK